MNYKILIYIIGNIIRIEGLLMGIPLLISVIFNELFIYKISFLIPMLVMLFIGTVMTKKFKNIDKFYTKEGIVIVALGWIIASLFGAVPYYISQSAPKFIDAFFESASGFTTTGSTIIINLDILPKSIIFWRSFTNFIGGMGILVFTLAIMPKGENQSSMIMKAEVTGPVFGKIVAKARDTAIVLYLIYFFMTFLLFIFLVIGKIGVFNSILYAMATAGAGGFDVSNAGLGAYNSTYLDIVLTIGMISFGINYNLYYFFLVGHAKEVFKNEELRWYLGLIIISTLIILSNVYKYYSTFFEAFRNVLFTVSSTLSTTGFSIVDFDKWPLFSKIIILCLMFIGGSTGSTAGGIKVSRFMFYVKSSLAQIRKAANPNRVKLVTIDNKKLDDNIREGILGFLAIYILLFFSLLIILSHSLGDFMTSFSATVSTLSNVGYGLGQVGPELNFANMSNINKLVLTFAMFASRLEIIPVLILFSPRTWKKTS